MSDIDETDQGMDRRAADARRTLASLIVEDGRAALDLTVAELLDLPDGEFRAQIMGALNFQPPIIRSHRNRRFD